MNRCESNFNCVNSKWPEFILRLNHGVEIRVEKLSKVEICSLQPKPHQTPVPKIISLVAA